MSDKWLKRRKRLFEIIEVGNDLDYPSRVYDLVNVLAIVINLAACILVTFSELQTKYGYFIGLCEKITVVFFLFDYALRIWTAKFLYPESRESRAIRRYLLSFTGIVDLLSFLPDLLPIFFL